MEHLETQVSDLRSFLPGGAPPVGANSAAAAVAAGSAAMPIGMAGGAMGIGALSSTPRHPSQSAGSPVSAVGSNSAHPSPLPYNPNHDAAQSSRSFNPSSLSGGPTATHGSATVGGKRKQDSGLEDASLKQQRSKRNRVSLPFGLLSPASDALRKKPLRHRGVVETGGANLVLELYSISRLLGTSLPCSRAPHTIRLPWPVNRGWAQRNCRATLAFLILPESDHLDEAS